MEGMGSRGLRDPRGMRNWQTNLGWSHVSEGCGEGGGVFCDPFTSFPRNPGLVYSRGTRPLAAVATTPRRTARPVYYHSRGAFNSTGPRIQQQERRPHLSTSILQRGDYPPLWQWAVQTSGEQDGVNLRLGSKMRHSARAQRQISSGASTGAFDFFEVKSLGVTRTPRSGEASLSSPRLLPPTTRPTSGRVFRKVASPSLGWTAFGPQDEEGCLGVMSKDGGGKQRLLVEEGGKSGAGSGGSSSPLAAMRSTMSQGEGGMRSAIKGKKKGATAPKSPRSVKSPRSIKGGGGEQGSPWDVGTSPGGVVHMLASGGSPERRGSTQEEVELEQRKQDELTSHLDSHERLASTFAASLGGENSVGFEPTMSGSGSFSRMDLERGEDSGGGGVEEGGNGVEERADEMGGEGSNDVKGGEVEGGEEGEQGGEGDGTEGEREGGGKGGELGGGGRGGGGEGEGGGGGGGEEEGG